MLLLEHGREDLDHRPQLDDLVSFQLRKSGDRAKRDEEDVWSLLRSVRICVGGIRHSTCLPFQKTITCDKSIQPNWNFSSSI